MIITTIASFGLHAEVPPTLEFGGSSSTAQDPSSPSPTATSFGPTISPRRATFSRFANKWASKRPMPMPTAPKWLSHKKNYSHSAKMAVPGFNVDRRPSVPTLPSLPLAGTFVHTKSPLAGSTTSFQTTPLPGSGISQEWEDVGTESRPTTKDELLVRLLRLRYRVAVEGGWYLGKSKMEAKHLVDRCVIDAEDIAELRALFTLEVSQPSTPSTASTFGPTPPQSVMISDPVSPSPAPTQAAPSIVPLSPVKETDLEVPRNLISPLSFASFDLEEYYARIASQSSHTPKLSLASVASSTPRTVNTRVRRALTR